MYVVVELDIPSAVSLHNRLFENKKCAPVGADDTFGTAAVARHVVELMPHASLTMVPSAGNFPWLDDPEGLGRGTADFLAATD